MPRLSVERDEKTVTIAIRDKKAGTSATFTTSLPAASALRALLTSATIDPDESEFAGECDLDGDLAVHA